MFPGIEEGTWTFTKVREARDGEKEDLIAQAKGQRAAEAAAARAASQADDAVKDEDKDDGEDDGDDDDGDEDEDMEDGEAKDGSTPSAPGPLTESKDKTEPSPKTEADGDEDMEDDMGEGIYIEDEDDEEGAVWCMKEGRVVDWGCFFALLWVLLPCWDSTHTDMLQNICPRSYQPDIPYTYPPSTPSRIYSARQADGHTIRFRETQDPRFLSNG